ncbi:MAG: ubiquitin-conjugating enzyme E2 [Armatimonadota bacterium]
MIRTRRLQKDYEKVIAELSASELVAVKPLAGDPPNHYRVTYHLNGLAWDEESKGVKPVTEHVVEIFLPMGYPRQAPRCIMRTPIWHPNIGDYVCIGDFWSAGVALVDIIAHIGDMIQYRSYNLTSPVNKEAAAWARRNEKSFPVGTRTVVAPAGDSSNTDGAVRLSQPRTRPDELEITLGPIRDRDL